MEQKLYVRRSGGQGTRRLESLEGASLKKMGHSNIEWPISESYKCAIITALRVDRVPGEACVVLLTRSVVLLLRCAVLPLGCALLLSRCVCAAVEVRCAAVEVRCVAAEARCVAAEALCCWAPTLWALNAA